ncbi:MAG: glycoside hydrolase family 3 protein, partial [Pseudomonadales bacterium]
GANAASFGSAAHREVAREAVRRSQVLLKNDGVLPIDPSATVLVAGKTADNLGLQCGGWTVSWQGQTDGTGIAGTSIWQGIKSLAPSAELSQDGSGADAARHDVAIVVVGETPYAEGRGDIRASDAVLQETAAAIEGSMSPLEAYASSMKLADIHPEDLACIRRVSAAGVPVVVVLVSGRPLIVDEELSEAAAFVAAWLPGTEGLGVAEPLFGHCDFEGRLPVAWVGESSGASFPVGYGLSVATKE